MSHSPRFHVSLLKDGGAVVHMNLQMSKLLRLICSWAANNADKAAVEGQPVEVPVDPTTLTAFVKAMPEDGGCSCAPA